MPGTATRAVLSVRGEFFFEVLLKPPMSPALRRLRNAIAQKRLAHAYLFVGSSGTLGFLKQDGLSAQERQLRENIERDLKREPPPEVHALLGEYRRGADRASLLASVQREFPNDLALRVTVLRWIDQVRPEPGQSSPAPAAPGQGKGKSWVRPLERR